MSASAASRAAVRSPARSSSRRAAVHRPARPAAPRVPEDFFSEDMQRLLSDLLSSRAKSWKEDWLKPIYYYGRDSEPLWGADAGQRCSGTTLRVARRNTLCTCLCMDLERGLRLLTLVWTPEGDTADGHSSKEWRAALAGVCWRVGQLLRELTRRWGEAEAKAILHLAMDTLWR